MGFLYSVYKAETHNDAFLYKQMLQQNAETRMSVDLPLGSPDCRQIQKPEKYLVFPLLGYAYDINIIKFKGTLKY